MLYHPPYGVTDPNSGYVNGDPSQGLAGSIPPAQSIEYPQREIVNLISTGYVPSDADLFQLTRGVRRAFFAFATDTGSQNALSIAVNPPIIAYEQGTELRVLVAFDNTGPSTIRVNGLSTQQIVRKDGTPLSAGDMRRGGIAVIVYDGANFQLVSGTSGSITIAGAGWFNGADYIVDVGTPNHIVGSPQIAPTAYSAGQGFTVYVKNQNTGPTDINVNALGIIPILTVEGTPLSAGDLMPNMLIRLWYDGSNFHLLSPIYMQRIDQAVAFIVGPNAGANFVDLNAALYWLSRRRIDTAGSVTFNLQGATSGAAMVHSYSANIIIEHPDGDRLTITGPAPTRIPHCPGDFTAHNPGYTAAAINSDANLNNAMLRAAFRTELRLTGTYQMFCRGRVGLLQNFMVTGGASMPVSGAGKNLINIENGWTSINTVAACNSQGCTWYIDENATLDGVNMYAVGSMSFSIGVAHAANLLIGLGGSGHFYCGQAYVDGIQMSTNGIVDIAPSTNPTFYGIGQWGIDMGSGGGAVYCPYITSLFCGWGLIQNVGGYAYVYNSAISYANQGYACYNGGAMDCDTCYSAAISAGDYVCAGGAWMYAAGFQNGGAQFSPAPNTVGNGNALIEA